MNAPLVKAYEILDRITDGFFAIDGNWCFTYVNIEASRLLFRDRDNLIGKNIWEEFPEAVTLPFYEYYHRSIMDQVPISFDCYFPPLDTWFDVRAYPSPNGLTVYFQDITRKKKSLAQTEQHYQSLFEQNPDAVFSLDLEGNYLSVNPAMKQLLGYSEEELLGSSFVPLVPEEDLERTIKLYKEAANGSTQNYQTTVRHKDGRIVHADVTNMPIVVNNEVVGVYGIAKDITVRKLEQVKLREHEEFFQLITGNSQDIISIETPQSGIEYISPSVSTLLGYEPEETIGKPGSEYWHPDDATALRNSGILKNSNIAKFDCRAQHKEGHYVWFETTVKFVRNDQGEVVKAIGIGRDITQRKQAEEELRSTKERLESFVHHSADAIWVIDLEDRVLEINPAFETLFGWSADHIIGQKLPIIPDFLKDSIQDIHQKVKTGSSMAGLETIRLRRDGSLVNVSATLSPIRNSADKVIGITGICRDNTQRIKAEDALKAKTQQLESFIENNVDAILIFNHKGIVVRMNKAFQDIFGWTEQEIIGVALNDLPSIPVEYKDEARRFEMEVKKGSNIIGTETIRLRKDGLNLNVMLSISPIKNAVGELDGWSVTLRDITEWKKSQELLQNTEKLSVAGQLAAGIAHEIRNPMTAIKGFIHLMKSGFGDKKEYFEIMSSEMERIEQILSELLILAKPQVSKFERKDVRILLAQVITLLDTQAIMNNVEIVTEFQPGVTHIQCDENQLKQVFINFIKNAIEAMPQGGKVVIQIRRNQDKRMIIRFIDQGMGMPKEILSKLGEPFYTTKEKGTGLGFMVSKRIIENHFGEVQIESELNQGTTIEVNLPLIQEHR